jgi:hypothetical protein
MTPEERDIIGRFIARVGGAGQQSGFAGSSVPATQQALPPVDPEADRFISDQFQSYPEARYRITQMAFVQEAALAEAQNRIKRLEYDLQQTQAQARQGGGQSKGFFSGLFGGGQQAPQGPGYQQPQYAPPPPQPAYPPGYQPGMFRSGGSGFLGSALTTAAGVAGGVLAADALTSMFTGPHYGGGFGGGGFGGGFGGGMGGGEVVNETVVNNYGDAGNPWSGAGAPPDAGGGGWTGGGGGGGDPWSGAGTTDSGWAGGDAGGDSGGGDSGGGWDDSGGGGGGGDGGF